MSLSKFFSKKADFNISIEVEKGCLELDLLKEFAKKEFDDDKSVEEVSVIGSQPEFVEKLKDQFKTDFSVELKISESYVITYVLVNDKKGDLLKVSAIVTDEIAEDLSGLLEKNNQIIRFTNK
jgi:hypothetical protein